MAWIELHQSLWTHRKTYKLAAELQILPVYAAGHMAQFWCWALDNVPDGDLSDINPHMIAIAAGWPGEPEKFYQAALTAGFFEQADGGAYIHNWDVYVGKLIEKRAAERERSQRRRSQAKHQTTAGRPPDDQETTVGTVPNQHYPTNTTVENHNRSSKPAHQDDYSDDFEEFWMRYPRHVAKREAYAKWKARIKEGAIPSVLIAAAGHYAMDCINRGTDEKYIKHPATFLGPSKHYEDYLHPPEPPRDKVPKGIVSLQEWVNDRDKE